jgi:hypothetical protein
MKILAIEKDVPGITSEHFKPYLRAEAQSVWELYQSGVFRECYYREDHSNAVIILECSNLVEAQNILNTLPLVKEKLIKFEMIPLKSYPGFSRLFAKETSE